MNDCKEAFEKWWNASKTVGVYAPMPYKVWQAAWDAKPAPPVADVPIPSVYEMHDEYKRGAYTVHRRLERTHAFIAASPEHTAGLEAIHALLTKCRGGV